MRNRSRRTRRGVAALAAAAAAVTWVQLVPASRVVARVTVTPRAAETTTPLLGTQTLALPFAARDVALHWAGRPDATVTLQASSDGVRFTAPTDAGRDEVGEQRQNGETYGSVVGVDGATVLRVTSDEPLARLSVVSLADGPRA